MQNLINEVLSQLDSQEYCFNGLSYPLLMISSTYPGLWLEHVYDAVFYAQMNRNKLYLAENAINVFIDHQTPDGQLPFVVRPAANTDEGIVLGYSQIQECVSFGSLAYMVYEMNHNSAFLKKAYESIKKWTAWLKTNRMTGQKGLVELFCGFDTGHDNSARVLDLGCPMNYVVDGKKQNAAVLPPDDNITPIIALDMNCNYYGNLMALARMASALNEDDEVFIKEAKAVKKRIFETCFDEEDVFFYDVDKHGNKRKLLSSQIFHLFMEGVLDPKEDKELINELSRRYIFNKNHFYTPYPFPSVSISDPQWKKHTESNCWGYFTQGLIVLRCTLWMDRYGFTNEFDQVCRAWKTAWEKAFDTIKFGQELDPVTGEPSSSSQWYSSCMLMYLYACSRS